MENKIDQRDNGNPQERDLHPILQKMGHRCTRTQIRLWKQHCGAGSFGPRAPLPIPFVRNPIEEAAANRIEHVRPTPSKISGIPVVILAQTQVAIICSAQNINWLP